MKLRNSNSLTARVLFAVTVTSVTAASGVESPARREQLLAELAGNYVLTSRFWSSPTASPQASTLSARRNVILQGRVLHSEVGSAAAGFQGTGLMGYDGSGNRFWYVWTDTTTTGRSILHGSLDEHGRGTLEGETPGPVGYAPLRVEIRREGAIEIHEYFGPGEDGKTFRWMELRYERRD